MILADMLRITRERKQKRTKKHYNKIFGLPYSPNKIRATSWRKMILAGNGRSEKCI